MSRPRLQVVMPVHNEIDDLEATLVRLRGQLDDEGMSSEPIIVVDDGSTDGTSQRLDLLSGSLGLCVLHQENAGRYPARLAGLRASSADYVVLLDCGIEVTPGSFRFLAERLASAAEPEVWNADVSIDTSAGPCQSFWKATTSIVWRRYFADRRLCSYALDDFDYYPKGTSLFCAPREWLLEATEAFQPQLGKAALASDDSAIIRELVVRADRIWLSPQFGCRYSPRTKLTSFARHARHRGTVFVDGYLRAPGRFGQLLRTGLACAPAAIGLGAGLVMVRPRACVGAVAAGAVVAAGTARGSGCTWRESAGFVSVTPVFAVAFGSGVLRGLRLSRTCPP